VAKVHTGSTPNSGDERFWNGDIIWITPQDLSNPDLIYIVESNRKITSEGLQVIGGELVPPNTIVISTRAPIGSIGISKISLTFNQGCKGIEVLDKDSCPAYFYYLFFINKNELQSLGKGTTFTELSSQSLKDFLVCKPPLEEQRQIVQHIETETKRIDGTISKIKQEIELLQEYRTALISEVVTGKIKIL
jgi:type I restriction enzyme S subunit